MNSTARIPLVLGIMFGALISQTMVASAYDGDNFVVCKLDPNGDNFLALRSCGSSKCKMVRKLKTDDYLLTMNPDSVNNWREVILLKGPKDESYSGPSGWVYDKYICDPS